MCPLTQTVLLFTPSVLGECAQCIHCNRILQSFTKQKDGVHFCSFQDGRPFFSGLKSETATVLRLKPEKH